MFNNSNFKINIFILLLAQCYFIFHLFYIFGKCNNERKLPAGRDLSDESVDICDPVLTQMGASEMCRRSFLAGRSTICP